MKVVLNWKWFYTYLECCFTRVMYCFWYPLFIQAQLYFIFSKGIAYRFNKRLAIRIVIATWSLGALLLINYYNSLCISFLTIPIKKPLIQSIEELQNHPEIRLVMNKNQNTASLVLVNSSYFNIEPYQFIIQYRPLSSIDFTI